MTHSDDRLEITADVSLLSAIRTAAVRAGRETLAVRTSGDLGVVTKTDGSPVTRADESANDIILRELELLCPGVPTVSEESPISEFDLDTSFFLVDPVDGTKNFIAGRDDFTINIGLICARKPAAGVIFAPATGHCYWTNGSNSAVFEVWNQKLTSYKQRRLTPVPNETLRFTALVSKSYLNQPTIDWLDQMGFQNRVTVGSSLKLALLADGQARCYPRLSPIWEWDTAAGHAILSAVGGTVLDAAGTAPLEYGKPEFLTDGFLAYAKGVPTTDPTGDQGS